MIPLAPPGIATETSASETIAPPLVWQRPAVATGLCFVVTFILIFGAFSVGHKINVDENVFIASAALLSRHGVIPYRDYHYNHMPTQVMVYALLFKLTTHILLAARTLCALCAAGAVAIIFSIAYRRFAWLGQRKRVWFCIGITLLFLADPLFNRTAGRAWNHDFPVLLSLLAYLAMARGLRGGHQLLLIPLSGLLVGLAVTSRLTFATEMLPFALFILIYPRLSTGRRMALLGLFALGGITALLPSAWFWAQAPRAAYFDNFQYPAYNTIWHKLHDRKNQFPYGLLPKLLYIPRLCVEFPGNGVVTISCLLLVWSALRRRLAVAWDDLTCQLVILALLAASQLASAITPSPPFYQYFYAATPFMMLAIILALADRPGLDNDPRLYKVMIGFLSLAFVFGVVEYRLIYVFPSINKWQPVWRHDKGVEMARLLGGHGRVLTLDPIYPLEGGLDIYPELATGRFAIRVGDYLTPQQRAAYRMWGTKDIDEVFTKDPPAAVFISPGSDAAIEPQMIADAIAHGYMPEDLKPVGTVFVSPQVLKSRAAGSH